MKARRLWVLGLACLALGLAARLDATPTADGRPAAADGAAAAAARTTGARAAVLVRARVPEGWTVAFLPARRGAPRADADLDARRIRVFVAPGDPAHRVAHDLAHELGHAWDAGHLDAAGRRAYLARRGAPSTPWWPGSAWADYASGAGDFAEVFARCHAASPDFRSRVAAAPADACSLLPRGAR